MQTAFSAKAPYLGSKEDWTLPGNRVRRKFFVRARLLLGPAGSGKTFRCLTEIREALLEKPEGPPLLLVAPKQATFQLERQLLADPSLLGYTRLQILSFERLAYFILAQLGKAEPDLLEEEGRVMVMRALLARKQLKLFRASARLTGFAQQLSEVLRELQASGLTPQSLRDLAGKVREAEGLAYKLEDMATLLEEYQAWLQKHQLEDADSLLQAAVEALEETGTPSVMSENPLPHQASPASSRTRRRVRHALFGEQLWMAGLQPVAPESVSKSIDQSLRARLPVPGQHPKPKVRIEKLWVDGFSELTEPQTGLLAAVLPYCGEATITFCLESMPEEHVSWLSTWSVVQRSFRECRNQLADVPGVQLVTKFLERDPVRSRFAQSAALRHLEKNWAKPQSLVVRTGGSKAESRDVQHRASDITQPSTPEETDEPAALRAILCTDPEGEVVFAARHIRRHVREGGRFRDVTILVRNLEGYHQVLRRVLSRYEIPFFMDRREGVSHHPLAELTRHTLRTLTLGWQHEDWFAVLKTGLIPATDAEIDRLENEALAHGWKGGIWQQPIEVNGDPGLALWLAGLQRRIMPPFEKLLLALGEAQHRPSGVALAAALRTFWEQLRVEQRLKEWTETDLATDQALPSAVHATVWQELNAWLHNMELAFGQERLPLRDWLPILEAGLSSLSVGVIPPALDQVLIGSVERLRNPEVNLTILLGLNEGVFPAAPKQTVLLSEADRTELARLDLHLTANPRHQLGRERFYAYVAFTRSKRQLVVSSAQRDSNGAPLNPSPFLGQLQRMFPALQLEAVPRAVDWRDCEHGSELARLPHSTFSTPHLNELAGLPSLASVFERLAHYQQPCPNDAVTPELAARLYGPRLRTSVSRIEQFACCPFKFFVHSGLHAQERKKFELDIREQGTFQHDVLALFHEQLRQENKRWRDITPAEARERIGRIAGALTATYREGLLKTTEQTRFLARLLTESLQDFIETLVAWMRNQYLFEPIEVELPFGEDPDEPAWELNLKNGLRLVLQGRIDRIDLWQNTPGEPARCVVIDYKSGYRQLDSVLLANGVQLQLLAYLSVVRHWPNPMEFFGARRLIPAGAFYVNLRGKYKPERNRRAALTDTQQARQLAYRHTGRFDAEVLQWLDSRPDVQEGDQFNYRLTKKRQVNRNCREALPSNEFLALLDSVETNLRQMGERIFAGDAQVAPYRRGMNVACAQCNYRGICRIDPWTHRYRLLPPNKPPSSPGLAVLPE